jgi:hypothetical protein
MKVTKTLMFLAIFCKIIGFLIKGMLANTVLNSFCDASIAKSTGM